MLVCVRFHFVAYVRCSLSLYIVVNERCPLVPNYAIEHYDQSINQSIGDVQSGLNDTD